MENFVLYHEIYKRDGMTMYKGRKKGTITYVAISCIDKGERIKVTNHVRLVYELEHEHVVKFYEWYETSNHLWLVTELCVGGTLAQILQQDVRLPESAVRVFGCHLVRGIHHMHGNELVYANWHPSKIILAGDGSLKFFDFSDSRKVNEDPKDLMQRFFSTLNLEQSEIEDLLSSRPVSEYTAPEVVQGSPPGPPADIWGLGCILYEMFAGAPPFADPDTQQLTRLILHSPLIVPRAHSASTQLNDLLQRMLSKQPESRLSLADVCAHPFWDGCLKDIVGPCSAVVSASPRTAHGPVSVADDNTSTSTVDDVSFTLHLGSRPAEGARDVQVTQFNPEPQETLRREAPGPPNHQQLMAIATASSTTTKTHNDDFTKMTKDGRLKFDPKLLPVAPYSLAKWRALRKTDKDKHLKQLESLFKTGEKGPPSQRRLHLVNYLAQMSMCAEVSNHVIECGLAMDMCRQLKGCSNQEWLARVCQCLAVIYHYNSCQEDSVGLYGDAVAILADVLRDQFRCTRVKLPCVSALGEALIGLARGSNEVGGECVAAAVPLSVTLLQRCLHRTEDVSVSVCVARVIEAVCVYSQSSVAKTVICQDTATQLYTAYTHAATDTLKVCAMAGLSGVCRNEPGLFQSLLEKVGGHSLLDSVHTGLVSVQEMVLEMYVVQALSAGSTHPRGGQDSGCLVSAMRLLECTAALVRAKALLLVLEMCKGDLGLLKVATDHRLVLYLDRETKRTATVNEHEQQCLSQVAMMLTSFLAHHAVNAILTDCLQTLEAVQGRKHPSSVQTKALRRALPQLESVVSIVSSSVLRGQVLSSPDSYCQCLGALVTQAHLIHTGQTTLPPDIAPHFLSHIMTLVETAVHCPEAASVVVPLLVPLATLTEAATSADLRIIGLKLCGDMIQRIEAKDSEAPPTMDRVTEAVEAHLLPRSQQFLTDPDPSPVCLLRLLRHYLALATDSCISAYRTHRLPHSILQVLIDHQARPLAATVLESLLLLSAVAQVSGGLCQDLVVEADLVAVLCEVVLDIGDHYHHHKDDEDDQQAPRITESLLAGIEALYGLSRLISDVVRTALQSKKKGDSEEVTSRLTSEAEELLGAGKPLTEMVDLLIASLGNGGDREEVSEAATRLLNQVVSLYGGQQIQHGLREANVRSLCEAVCGTKQSRTRRTLLRILKRLLVSGGGQGVGMAGLGGHGDWAMAVGCVRHMAEVVVKMCKAEGDSASEAVLEDIVRSVDQ